MTGNLLYHTYQRIRTLRTGMISALPVVILMPHSGCNCKCVMCDIWKGNSHVSRLTEADIAGLLSSLRKYGTRQVLMSGGEALLHPGFFRFCEILNDRGIKVSLHSTGMTLQRNAGQLVKWVSEIILSIDGDEATHDRIRNIPGAFRKLKEGIKAIRDISPEFKITGRTVIHQMNYKSWPALVDTARKIGLDRISFLPADVSSSAFNRESPWDESRQMEILLAENELPDLKSVIEQLLITHARDFAHHFIAESPEKIWKIYGYYAAFYGRNDFPFKRCNAPWVSTVIEADGKVRPCFFHEPFGNIRLAPLNEILNSEKAIRFRRELDMETNETCRKCVCYLHLAPGAHP